VIRYVYTAAQVRSWHRMLAREVRKNRLASLIERGLLDLGGEAGGA
jgi:hypothetical protein